MNKKTVLCVEDNPANLRLVARIVEQYTNYSLLTAVTPEAGLEQARTHRPDLILLDINLPGMSGYEVFRILRKEPATCDIPVVAVSANAMPRDVQKAGELGFDEYITKPIDVVEFQTMLERRLGDTGRPD